MRTFSRRAVVGTTLAGMASAPSLVALARQQATPGASPVADVTDPAAAILAIVDTAMQEFSLRAVLLHVTIGGEVVTHQAMGESLTGVPATPEMHVRNGAVAITYMSTLLLRLVDEGVVRLDDTIDAWLPDLPDAGQVTLRMLSNMTSGYPDYVQNAEFIQAFYEDPFHAWTTDEQLGFAFASPRLFAPGENWDYAHTNYVILGLVMEAVTGEPLDALLRKHILDPLDLTGTGGEQTAAMPEPVLHAFSAERRPVLGIAEGTPFLEESTSWDPSWTLARGSVQYSTVADMATSFAAIGRGDLLSGSSMRELLNRDLLGFGEPLEGCPSCHTFDERRLYGLGVWLTGGWMLQNPLFGGYAGIAAYHPEADVAIAVANTVGEGAFDKDGNYTNASAEICARITALLVPDDPIALS